MTDWLTRSRDIERELRSHRRAPPGARPDTWLTFDRLGICMPYLKTFEFSTAYVDADHRKIAESPGGRHGQPFLIDLGIDGYLMREDALKVYELARLCEGDVLELGTHKGLSTSVIALALHNRGSGQLHTVDIDAEANALAREALATRPGRERVTFELKDATEYLDQLVEQGRKFGFVFIDHWHGFQATYEAAIRLSDLLRQGGYALFHDFIDAGNAEEDHPYGVYPAVIETIACDPRFQFYGNFGCCGLFRWQPDWEGVASSERDAATKRTSGQKS